MKIGIKTRLFYFFINLMALISGLVAMPIYCLWAICTMVARLTITDGSEMTGFPWEWSWNWRNKE